MPCLKTLTLSSFRNYHALDLKALNAPFVVLTGPNGAGKTNVLEAISYLGPGRGLRSADLADCQMRGLDARQCSWVVAATLESDPIDQRLGTQFDPITKSRSVYINGARVKAQADLTDYLSIHWLTPAQDRLFMDGTSDRRRFFDRMVYAFDAAHAGRITRYEKALSERSKLLRGEQAPDPLWLRGLESQMAEASVAIAAARRALIARLNAAVAQNLRDDFPQPHLTLKGYCEQGLETQAALDVEDRLKALYQDQRAADAMQGGAGYGAHRADFQAHHVAKDMPAALCSTGEQKALLIGLVLAFMQLLRTERQRMPVLLFDEVAAHLDEVRRAALYERLAHLGGQVFLTGTDEALFSPIQNAVRLHVASGLLEAA